MKRLTLTIIAAFCLQVALAQNIRGKVVDEVSLEPQETVAVSQLANHSAGKIINQYGNFSLISGAYRRPLIPGSYIDYKPVIVVNYTKSCSTKEKKPLLSKYRFILEAVVTYSYAGYELGFSVENLLDIKLNEALSTAEPRMKYETDSVTELNYAPGTPHLAMLRLGIFL